ncbi:MAG: HD domain-containing protein [Thermoproteus sp. AZ2]|jgi:putative hydrolase of HD superfamily|uniref:HD domain-containing protein n=1 Tax=Thermoproteus sp. AZ2 TaxID=1609232 RepID=A0ACC6V0Q2_9CREN|nr:MAG: phosphohydrolase [Thermoproteus sp. AZ2]
MDLLTAVDALCGIRRIGWLQRGVQDAESVCQHSVLAALLAGEIAAKLSGLGIAVDPAYAVAAALLHDLPEAELGHPSNGVREGVDWAKLEEEAFKHLYPHLYDLFSQYRRRSTDLGLLVSFADKLATLIRACAYRRRGYPTDDLIEAFKKRLGEYPDPYPELLEEYVKKYC